MFLKSLKIENDFGLVRDEIKFKQGLNLIVDETPITNNSTKTRTGNNVGKTTVLKLIDFCLGANANIIYTDIENTNKKHSVVKDFLEQTNVIISLTLTQSLNNQNNNNEIVIKRNFLGSSKCIRCINSKRFANEEDFWAELNNLIFDRESNTAPTFRQIISHNIRYKELSITNMLKTFPTFGNQQSLYEAVYLFLLGIEIPNIEKKQLLTDKLKYEKKFKQQLESNETKTGYQQVLASIENEISELTKKRDSLNNNENYLNDIDKLDNISQALTNIAAEISLLKTRQSFVQQCENDLKNNHFSTDLTQLKSIYQQATKHIDHISKTFDAMVLFHNEMITEKIKFITQELPFIIDNISALSMQQKILIEQKTALTKLTQTTPTAKTLDKLNISLNECYKKKGECEGLIKQIIQVEDIIHNYTEELTVIENDLYSAEFQQIVANKITEFNKFFSNVSKALYSTEYVLKHNLIYNKDKTQTFYEISSVNMNFSDGIKQGEILCFDIAYIQFANKMNIPCLHFILNDKKELLHDNQLSQLYHYLSDKNIQVVASILKDKIPDDIKADTNNFILQLSQDDKLFRIESFSEKK